MSLEKFCNLYFYILLFFIAVRLPIVLNGSGSIVYSIIAISFAVLKPKIITFRFLLLITFSLTYLLFSQLFWFEHSGSLFFIKAFKDVLVYFLLFIIFMNEINNKNFLKIYKFVVSLVILYLSLELFLRFNYPIDILNIKSNLSFETTERFGSKLNNGFSLENFHAFKLPTIAFWDTNYQAYFLLPFLVSSIALSRITGDRFCKISVYLIMLLIIFTFSRAVIFTSILVILAIWFKNTLFKTFLLFGLIIFVFSILDSYLTIGLDSKLDGLFAISKLANLDFASIIFGQGSLGYYSLSYQEGMFSHSTLSISLGVFGVLFSLLLTLFYLNIAITYNTKYIYVLLSSMLIAGNSLGDLWEPSFIFSLVIIIKSLNFYDLCFNNHLEQAAATQKMS